jgi:hypothetical protein
MGIWLRYLFARTARVQFNDNIKKRGDTGDHLRARADEIENFRNMFQGLALLLVILIA